MRAKSGYFLRYINMIAPRRDFAQKAKSQGGTVVTRSYIIERYLQLKYTVSIPEQISICLNRGREESIGNEDVCIVCARKYEMVLKDDVKRENPEGTAQVDFVTLIVQLYFDTLLRYVLSVTFCGAVVLKVMDQKTLVKRR